MEKKVAIFQPLVPKYRVPFYEKVNSNFGIKLTIYSGGSIGSLSAEINEGNYETIYSPVRVLRLYGVEFKFQFEHLLINPKGFDVIVASWDAHYVSLLFLIIKCRLFKTPIILWGHGYSKKGAGLRDFVRNIHGKLSNAVLVYSNTVADQLVLKHGYKKENVYVAQNALAHDDIGKAINNWRGRNSDLQDFRIKNQLDIDCTIIFVSRLEKENDIDLMFLALKKTLKKYPTCKLVLVGDGSDKSRLEARASECSVGNSVIFVGSIYVEANLAPWMLSATLFCYPKNIGLSIHHAFCYGLPVVTSQKFKMHNPEIELLKNKENGLVYSDGSWEEMANVWDIIISDRQLRNRMSDNARTLVYEKYTLKNMAQGFSESINSVIK